MTRGGGGPLSERASTGLGRGRVIERTALLGGLAALLVVAMLVGVGVGAVGIAPSEAVAIVLSHLGLDVGASIEPQHDAILWSIRLPRVLLGALIGGGLAISGATLQGLFRNPLADPGVIGVASGASVGAVVAIVLGISGAFYGSLQLCAFACGVAAAVLVYALSRHEGRTDTVTLILTGIAITAIASAVIGFLIARADDQQLRDIVFWSLGSLGAATWPLVGATAPFVLIGALVSLRHTRSLDLFALGEHEARHLGLNTERTRLVLVVGLALAVGASVAAAGVIAFVGLVVPHIVRLALGPGHAMLLPASFLVGATLLVLADLAARTLVVPSELPLGVVTSLVGGPFFLWLIHRTRRTQWSWR